MQWAADKCLKTVVDVEQVFRKQRAASVDKVIGETMAYDVKRLAPTIDTVMAPMVSESAPMEIASRNAFSAG